MRGNSSFARSLAWHDNPQQDVHQSTDSRTDKQRGKKQPPYPGFHSGRSRDSAAHTAEQPVRAAASKCIYGGREWVIGVRLLGVQQALLRALELLFRQATVGAQFREFTQFISQRHGSLLDGFIPLRTPQPRKSNTWTVIGTRNLSPCPVNLTCKYDLI